ncbi:TetR/AcrR family transcriptional regulator [Pokkaliibacter sp. MBI-7]|nr:TetR/AcrR family transcriptional regulator [Pokkaliibacter sp. MBI-7]MDH2432581.1 TetR/AcrR family transcriptional regulator [Pokkaliibacter sp. MBI-7]
MTKNLPPTQGQNTATASQHAALSDKESRSEARRNQILQAATDCFCAHGFHGASMSAISKMARMSPGHVYHYFDSKEAIIEAIVDRDLQQFYELSENLLQVDDLLDCMMAQLHVEEALQVTSCNPLIMVEMSAEASRNARVAAKLHHTDQLVRQRFRQLFFGTTAVSEAERLQQEARVEVICLIFDGVMVRGIHNPSTAREPLRAVLGQVLHLLLKDTSVTTPT